MILSLEKNEKGICDGCKSEKKLPVKNYISMKNENVAEVAVLIRDDILPIAKKLSELIDEKLEYTNEFIKKTYAIDQDIVNMI